MHLFGKYQYNILQLREHSWILHTVKYVHYNANELVLFVDTHDDICTDWVQSLSEAARGITE